MKGQCLKRPFSLRSACQKFFRTVMVAFCRLLLLIPLFWPFYIKVFDQYERGVHFRLGKVVKPAKGPGIFFFIPFVDTVITSSVCPLLAQLLTRALAVDNW